SMLLALAAAFLAQVHATTPPSQPTLPSPEERAMTAMRLAESEGSGDAHYLRRADGRHDDVADPREIDAALEAYGAAVKKSRPDADARWKSLRAPYFKAEYTGLPPEQKAALYDRAIPIADEAVAIARRRAADRRGGNPAGLEPAEIGTALAGDAAAA